MQSLPAHERRAPIEARWARLGPRVEAALALNCDALTRACLIDSIVRGGVRDGVNLSNEGLLEVYLARQSSGVRARGLWDVSRAWCRLTRRRSTCCSRDNRNARSRPPTPHSARRAARTRARAAPPQKAGETPPRVPRSRAYPESMRQAHAGRRARSRAETRPRLSRSSSRHGRDAARVRQFAAGLGRKFGCGVQLVMVTPVSCDATLRRKSSEEVAPHGHICDRPARKGTNAAGSGESGPSRPRSMHGL